MTLIEVPKTEPAPQLASAAQQFADALEAYFRITAFGLCAANPTIPNYAMWEAIASAMGAVISGATKSDDLKATLKAREHLSKVMANEIRNKYPALDMGGSTLLARAN